MIQNNEFGGFDGKCFTHFLVGYNNQSNYNSQGGGNQGFGTNHNQFHNPVGYGRGDGSMNYQYR